MPGLADFQHCFLENAFRSVLLVVRGLFNSDGTAETGL